ncbi:hypothetical protein V5F34_20595 [Xanthobacter autotrophicus]|uniref:hypothetical protein n=1 Tax=Xanthobacter autotrophicus TaxID=280 RepID=UPI0037272749
MSDTNRATPATGAATDAGGSVWLRELPYIAILLLTLGGVGYSAMTRSPLQYYWVLVAFCNCATCIYEGWSRARDRRARWRLIWTQILHWAAFLVAMALVFLPSVQAVADADSTSLIVLLLLALGTFVAGVHTASWRIGLNGVVMALCVPAVAWVDQSALLLSLGALAVILLGAFGFILWVRRKA